MSRSTAWVGIALAALAGCSNSVKVGPPQPGELIGRVEISADIPASSCMVLLEGTPLGGPCDESGGFDVRNVPPGRWDLRIVTDGAVTALPAKRIAAASNPGTVSDVGAVRLAQPGAIGGHVRANGQDLSLAIITVPEIGAVTAPNANGGYLLDAVSPGVHDVVLLTDTGEVVRTNITVLPGKVTIGADLDLAAIEAVAPTLSGRALRASAGEGGHGGLTVELVEVIDGRVVASATSADDGGFTLQARQGTFLVRARDGASPITAILPSVVVKGPAPITFSTALVVHPTDGDLNGNGTSNAADPDIDGDGVPNAMDAFPYDPAESQDSDGDGVGDRSDLKSQGGAGIDHQNATPDTDGDGKLDFEDDCPKVANPDQKDGDGDGVGDACDDCPFAPDADQKDSLGNGIGDACRTCKTNQDCPGGKLCNFGQCIACITNAQCGDEVCDKGTGSCRACASSNDCTAPDKCNALHRCVACLMTSDCPANMACVAGGCFPQCTSDASCPGQFCVSGACASCRGNGDCPSTQWCDAGVCKPQCTVNGDCSGGRTCDPVTRTCNLPCTGMCNNMQSCVSGACRNVCDGSKPCSPGFKCASGACVPECAVDGDCASVRPFTVCQAGACVSNGGCALDGDCPAAQLCVAGTCANRAGTLVAGKGYTCAQPCDCRTGETCSIDTGDGMTYCKPDLVPRWYAAAVCSGGGACDGSSPLQPSTNLTAVMSQAMAGQVVAVRAGDSFGGQTIGASGQALVGGFRVCAANRWVRDNTQRSTLTGSVSIPGSAGAPRTGVTVANLNVSSTTNLIDASFASGLVLSNLTVTNTSAANATVTFAGVSCSTCSNVSFSDIDMPGLDGSGGTFNAALIKLTQASGTLTRMRNGKFLGASFSTIAITNTTGPVTIAGTQSDGTVQTSGGAGISVLNASGGAVDIHDSQIGFASSGSSNTGEWDGIYVQGAPTLTLTNNTIDGRGVTEGSTSGNQTARNGIRIDGSNATVNGNTVYFPTAVNTAKLVGYEVNGPSGSLTFTNNSSSLGNTTQAITNLDIQNLSSGSVVIQSCNLTAGQGASSIGLRYYHNGGSFSIADSTFVSADGSGGTSYGGLIDTGVGRIERSVFKSAGSRAAVNALYTVSSQIELYDSYIYAGGLASGSGGSDYVGLYLDTGSAIFGVNNTIDGGASPGASYPSYGVYCPSTSTAIMTNNLINAGNSLAPYRLADNGAHSCYLSSPSLWSHNYLWYSSTATPNGNDIASQLAGMNGNLVAGNATCYDSAFLQPDYHIAATSPCVDQGAAAVRKDGTTIAVDLDNKMRSQGAAVDIGCHEVK